MKALCLALSLTAAAPPPAPPKTPPTSAPASPNTSKWRFKNGSSDIQITITGTVNLATDSPSVFSIEGDGSLHVSEKSKHHTRDLRATKERVIWTVNGVAQTFDSEGRAWLRSLLEARPKTPTPP